MTSAIAVDRSGNVFVAGTDFSDYGTLAYSNSGVPLWTNRYNGPGNSGDLTSAIAVDSDGNVFVTGTSSGVGSNSDYATIKYSNTGVPLWTNRYDGPGNWADQATAIAVDTNGDVLVTGRSANGSHNSNLGLDYAIIKYSSAGVPLWTNRYDGPAGRFDEATAIAVDGSGNVFVTGNSETDDTGVTDFVTLAYSGTGDLLWENRYDGPGNGYDHARAVAVDSDGNVLVTGDSLGNGTLTDFATIKYSNLGVPMWTNRYNGPANKGDQANAIAVDSTGNVFVTGSSGDSTGLYPDYATIKYSGAGVPLWTRRFAEPGNRTDFPYSIAVDGSGNVVVAGGSGDDNNTIIAPTVAYSNAGLPLWTNRISGELYKIAVDGSGNVFVTGTSDGDSVTTKYSSSVPPPRLDFQKLSNDLVLSWTNAGFNLQSAPFVTGPFTNLPAATSPYTNPLTGPQQFFRLGGN
jgi:hypothetical protein